MCAVWHMRTMSVCMKTRVDMLARSPLKNKHRKFAALAPRHRVCRIGQIRYTIPSRLRFLFLDEARVCGRDDASLVAPKAMEIHTQASHILCLSLNALEIKHSYIFLG